MFEYLVVVEKTDGERLEVVGLKDLLNHIERAVRDDDYCFTAYEIHQIMIDFSLPREGG